MAYVEVKLKVGGKIYKVEVDENADPKKLPRRLARGIGLPEEEDYKIKLVGALRIRPGATVELTQVEDDEAFRGLTQIGG